MMFTGGVIILDCNQTFAWDQRATQENTASSPEMLTTVRSLAPFALHDLCTKLGIQSTVINYVDRWETQELVELLCNWCDYRGLDRIIIYQ